MTAMSCWSIVPLLPKLFKPQKGTINNMKKTLLLLFALIVASGCIGSTVKSSNDAIVINEFSADPKIAQPPNDLVYFFIDIENVGGTTARCVTADLYGAESWYNQAGQPLTYPSALTNGGLGFDYNNGRLSFSYWDPTKGFLNVGYDRQQGMSLSTYVDNSWNQFTNNFCGSASSWSQFDRIKYFDSINPAVPSQNKPGQSFTTQWILQPPVLPEGVHTTYPVTARVSYLYTTNAQINLQAFNKAEAQRREALGQSLTFPITVETSYASPMQIAVTRGINPIIVNQRQPNFELVNYLIEFQNIGNGWPLPLDSDVDTPNGFIFATVELNGPGASFYDCLGAHSGTEVFVSGNMIQNLVKLRSDKRAPFGCTIAIDRASWADTPIGTISLTFNLKYRYYTDAQTSVDVLGLQENV